MENKDFNRIFITGDQHGNIDNILYLNFKENLSENDLVSNLVYNYARDNVKIIDTVSSLSDSSPFLSL